MKLWSTDKPPASLTCEQAQEALLQAEIVQRDARSRLGKERRKLRCQEVEVESASARVSGANTLVAQARKLLANTLVAQARKLLIDATSAQLAGQSNVEPPPLVPCYVCELNGFNYCGIGPPPREFGCKGTGLVTQAQRDEQIEAHADHLDLPW